MNLEKVLLITENDYLREAQDLDPTIKEIKEILLSGDRDNHKDIFINYDLPGNKIYKMTAFGRRLIVPKHYSDPYEVSDEEILDVTKIRQEASSRLEANRAKQDATFNKNRAAPERFAERVRMIERARDRTPENSPNTSKQTIQLPLERQC
ncbi:hypothetical protein HHI36_013190 [Cryptolaemus montrouzieri]|uniref:Uncharacterized protein n=1 Tax=Cryptolaemus montrouzieri TaxID=559131 RepID=A0ABD2NH25_9CUCU